MPSDDKPRLVVPPEQAGARLDRLVVGLNQVGSRRRAQAAIASGKVSIDGRRCSAEDIGEPVPAGAEIQLDWGRPGSSAARVKARRGLDEAGLRVIHQDRWLVAVDKPAGLLSDTATRKQAQERDSLRARLQVWLRAEGDAVHMVHRIDRDTSGVVLAARTDDAASDLKRQFRAHRPERVYWLAVQGVPQPLEGEWQDWMAWDRAALIQRGVPADTESAVLARARYRTLARRGDRASILEVRLHTGRRNQIRLHCSLRDHPLVGETHYLPEGWTQRGPRAPRQALHALRLGVLHPEHRKPVSFEAPLPFDLVRLARKLGLEDGIPANSAAQPSRPAPRRRQKKRRR